MPAPPPFKPTDNVDDMFNAVNPDQALEPEDTRYVDFSEWRSQQTARKMLRRIVRTQRNPTTLYTKQLITGHRGCGKTTELLRLKAALEKDGFFVVYFDSDKSLDINDVNYADLLLSILHEVAEQAMASPLKLKLNTARLNDLALRLARVTVEKETRTEVEHVLETEFGIGPNLPFILRVMATVKNSLKGGTAYRQHLRGEVQQRITLFLEDLNDFILDLQNQLHKKKKKGLVVIIDSLDRIVPRRLDDRGHRTSHSALFIEHAEHLKAPACHVVYTVPISLYFNENLKTFYGDTWMLPMVRIAEQSGAISAGGLESLYDAVSRRVLIEEVFENADDVRDLCSFCGGHVRDLMHLLRYAVDDSDDCISTDAIRHAKNELTKDYDRLVKDADLDKLVQVHAEMRLPSDDAFALLPYHLLVLEYENGGRWADVHPSVQNTHKFQQAWAEHRKTISL